MIKEECIWCGEPVQVGGQRVLHEACKEDFVENVLKSLTVVDTKNIDEIANIVDSIDKEGDTPQNYIDKLREIVCEMRKK